MNYLTVIPDLNSTVQCRILILRPDLYHSAFTKQFNYAAIILDHS